MDGLENSYYYYCLVGIISNLFQTKAEWLGEPVYESNGLQYYTSVSINGEQVYLELIPCQVMSFGLFLRLTIPELDTSLHPFPFATCHQDHLVLNAIASVVESACCGS